MKLLGFIYWTGASSRPDDTIIEADLTEEAISMIYEGTGSREKGKPIKRWRLEGRSTDGVHYKGSYGSPDPDPRRTFEVKLYFLDYSSSREFLLFGAWHSEPSKEDGSWTIVLSPAESSA